MGNSRGLIGLMMVMCMACSLNDELDRQDVAIEEAYFVECYLQTGELYNLTATKVQPIFDDFILDYSLDFDVFIIDADTTELFQSLFIEPETGYIYNYGSGQRLDGDLESVNLLVITPTGDTITSVTAIPDSINIDSTWLSGVQIVTEFQLSPIAGQNYYLHNVVYTTTEEDSIYQEYETQYLDLEVELSAHHQVILSLKNIVDTLDISVTLMRVTKENFDYQRSLDQAKQSTRNNITYPSPLEGNLINGVGIFTCYSEDTKIISAVRK
ncbi:MAG: DUF4249 domain-containing protein [Reichenbachiella sp.]